MRPRDLLDMVRRRGGARCVDVGRHIQTYLDGGLAPADAAKVAGHLDACRRCGLTADDYRRLRAALADHRATVPAEPLRRLQTLAAELAAGERTPS